MVSCFLFFRLHAFIRILFLFLSSSFTSLFLSNSIYLSILFIFFPQFITCLFVVLFGNFIQFSWFHVFYFSGYTLLFEFCSFSCQVPLLHCFCQIVILLLPFAFVAADQLENVNLSINIIYLSCALSSQNNNTQLCIQWKVLSTFINLPYAKMLITSSSISKFSVGIFYCWL